MSQRVLQQSARRLALSRPSAVSSFKFQSPASILLQKRPTSGVSNPRATSVSQNDGLTILANQRLHRPVAPHLQIYKPQITWILSSLNRITGCVLSGGLYVFGAAYVAAPIFGWQITSAGIAAAFAKWPLILKVLAKFSLAWPFTFHSFNGLRHLVWDAGKTISNKQVVQTGWVVLGLSTVSALYLTFI